MEVEIFFLYQSLVSGKIMNNTKWKNVQQHKQQKIKLWKKCDDDDDDWNIFFMKFLINVEEGKIETAF